MPANSPPSRFEQARPAYTKLVRHIARTKLHLIPGMDREELENELLEVLWLACNAYDPSKGCDFQTLFYSRTNQHISKIARNAHASKRGANVQRRYLSEEGVIEAVDLALSGQSAEDVAVARITALHEVLVLRKKAKKRVSKVS